MSDLDQEVMNSHTAFWQGYAERDLDKRFSVCADDVTFFGTGVHERAVGKKQYREMNEAGLRQSPLPFGINVLWYHLRIFGDVAWVECDTEWVQGIGGRQTNDLIRQTTIFKLEDGKWLVKHVHGSEPDYRLKAGEYMVNEEIAKRNSELERQVFERTKELENEKRITEQKSKELEFTLENLRTTQKQLIHSEKMASLGLLTSGVAHELKNPLNFVNNFAKISRDLIKDYHVEGDEKEKLILLSDLERNLEKIVHHGKRADNIVASMLMHSRMGNTQRVSSNVNLIIDEAIGVALLSERTKDEKFTCNIKKKYAENIPMISLIHQDFSLVMMNLFYNSFYAINQKKLTSNTQYEPLVTVETKTFNNQVYISVKDNGIGIADEIKDSIFQPFFTTKPTGEGTGLGLSLSYDIITGGHNGSVAVNTDVKGETEFIIALPYGYKPCSVPFSPFRIFWKLILARPLRLS